MVFLAIVSMLMAAFFGYHAKLCLTNTTTNEVLSLFNDFTVSLFVTEHFAYAYKRARKILCFVQYQCNLIC